MTTQLQASLVQTKDDAWSELIDALRVLGGAPNNPHLFPPHFLKSTFPKIGGQVIVFKGGGNNQIPVGVGFLFPRGLSNSADENTLRLHKMNNEPKVDT